MTHQLLRATYASLDQYGDWTFPTNLLCKDQPWSKLVESEGQAVTFLDAPRQPFGDALGNLAQLPEPAVGLQTGEGA